MGKSQYIIQFGGLPVGVHEFEFEIRDKFFQGIENSEIEKASLLAKAILTKQNNVLQVEFQISGTVGIACDRCMKDFDFPLDINEKLVVGHGNPEDSNDEILVIKEGDAEFDVSHYIYEYVALAVPARKVPCEVDSEAYECDDETLKKLESISTDTEKENSDMNNPMWEQLKKLKHKN
jgi:uncharacterized metal-binding protein YceD (DUF177 family)